MLGAKTNLKNAEKVKDYLFKEALIDFKYISKKDQKNIIFPINKEFKLNNVKIVQTEFKEKKKKYSWTDALKKELTTNEIDFLKTAHDVVGTIAIIEIPEELKHKETLIAETLLKSNPNIKTVLKKAGEHSGVYRTQNMTWLAGEKTKETIHKENNVKMKLNVEEVFFSARLATERKRIMKQIKPEEKIMVLFSGCAPYVCVFSKNTGASEVWGVELNPAGHKYALENVKLNKLTNVNLIEGDVHTAVPKIKEKFDRISMQLPKSAEDFLPEAFMIAKKGTIIHFYDFQHETEFDNTKKTIKQACEKAKLKYEFLDFVKCGQFSPGKFRVCLDFKLK